MEKIYENWKNGFILDTNDEKQVKIYRECTETILS